MYQFESDDPVELTMKQMKLDKNLSLVKWK